MIDTHCHLNLRESFPDPDAEVEASLRAGLRAMIVIGIDPETSAEAVALAEKHPEVYAAVGRHPTSAAGFEPGELMAMRKLARHPKVVAIGEIGLDFYWDTATPEQQHVCLDAYADLADELSLPAVLHCREANDALLDYLEQRAGGRWCFHCFSGNAEHARRALALDSILGVDGPITYPKSEELRTIMTSAPRDRVVLETDSPYLAPVPYRGKPNRPAYMVAVAAGLAKCWDVSVEDCAAQTTANACRFFRISCPK